MRWGRSLERSWNVRRRTAAAPTRQRPCHGGLLEFWRTPRDPLNAVTAIHSVFYRRDTGELLNPGSFDRKCLESGGRAEIALDRISTP